MKNRSPCWRLFRFMGVHIVEGLEGKRLIENTKITCTCPPGRKTVMQLDVQWSFLVNLEDHTSCPKEALKVDATVESVYCVSLGVLLYLSVLHTAQSLVSPALTWTKRRCGCFQSSKPLMTLLLRCLTLRTPGLWKSARNWGSFIFN